MRSGVCVGVAVHAEPARLADTVRFLRAHTRPDIRLVLLPDGPDEPTAAALGGDPGLAVIDQWATAEPQGMAACFNRLASRSPAGVVVLLESGALVGPRWLDLLLAAVDRDGCGLAGPSTNVSWNEQGIQPHARGDDAAVAWDAALALRRFGAAARTLDPLYSLADFCYAVRREVIDTIGLAEEAYGVGPCWEMDYNVRAARAGFRGIWVGASYVYRSPPTYRRATEAARMDANRRLYQDRFCGLRLRGETTLYRPHCLGDGCEHFAPDGLMPEPKLRPGAVPAREAETAPGLPAAAATVVVASARPRPAMPAVPPAPVVPTVPMVSCIMPTYGRTDFARQAVRYFQRQDYPNTELVIVESGPPELGAHLPDDPRIRIIPNDVSRSIGALRNFACQHARGEIVLQWDDDDWHGPNRVSRQVDDIRADKADITALRDAMVFDLERWQFWRLSARLHKQTFVRDVHGGTLAFRRWVWERLARYPDRSLAEDAAFLDQAVRRGARLCSRVADGLFLYLQHGTNSWRMDRRSLDGWEEQPEPDLPPEDRAYYARRCPAAPGQPGREYPLVSCIMPTMDRRVFVPRAIEYFRRQDYPARELVILDDGRDPVTDLVPDDDPAIVYRRLDHRLVLGAKRNLACEMARGAIIAHWDDDDWQAPHRLSTQVNRLVEGGHDLSGSRALRFYDPAMSQAWLYRWPPNGRTWAAGSSLCYTKDLWSRSPFPEVATGEDSRFVWSRAVRSSCDVSETDSQIAIIHRGNTVPKTMHGANWSKIPAAEVEQLLGPDLHFYSHQLDMS
jgi:glycosyltransferase involved in cell wall biosynthesis